MLKLICLTMQQKKTENISHIDTSCFALKSNLTSLKPGVDKLDIDKLKTLPNNLSNSKNKTDKLDIDKLKTLPNNLSNSKNKTDKLDIDKLAPVAVDLSKLTNVVKNKVAKKTKR